MGRSSTTRIVPRPPAASRGAAAARRSSGSAAVAAFAALGLTLSAAACGGIGTGPSDGAPIGSRSPAWLVVRVVGIADGDTIRVVVDGAVERVRIIGLDTPEVDEANRTPACYGAEATAFAAATLGGRTVTLETDPTQDERDRFGRLLVHVLVGDRLYAAVAIAGGYGIHYVYDEPSRHADELQAAEDAARREGAGLWSACDGRVDLPLASP